MKKTFIFLVMVLVSSKVTFGQSNFQLFYYEEARQIPYYTFINYEGNDIIGSLEIKSDDSKYKEPLESINKVLKKNIIFSYFENHCNINNCNFYTEYNCDASALQYYDTTYFYRYLSKYEVGKKKLMDSFPISTQYTLMTIKNGSLSLIQQAYSWKYIFTNLNDSILIISVIKSKMQEVITYQKTLVFNLNSGKELNILDFADSNNKEAIFEYVLKKSIKINQAYLKEFYKTENIHKKNYLVQQISFKPQLYINPDYSFSFYFQVNNYDRVLENALFNKRLMPISELENFLPKNNVFIKLSNKLKKSK